MKLKKEPLSELSNGVYLQSENAIKKSIGVHFGIWDGTRIESALVDFRRIAHSLFHSGYTNGLKSVSPKESTHLSQILLFALQHMLGSDASPDALTVAYIENSLPSVSDDGILLMLEEIDKEYSKNGSSFRTLRVAIDKEMLARKEGAIPKAGESKELLKNRRMFTYIFKRVFRHFDCDLTMNAVYAIIEENFSPKELFIMNSLSEDMPLPKLSKELGLSVESIQAKIDNLEYAVRAFFYANNDITPEEAFFDSATLNMDEAMQNFMDRLLFGEKKDKSVSLTTLALILEKEIAKGSPLVIDEEISRRDLFILNGLSRGESYAEIAEAFGVEEDAIEDRFTVLVHKLKHPRLIQPAIVY